MSDFGETYIDIEAMIEEMGEDALYRLDRMVKEGNEKQKRRMAGWLFLRKAGMYEALASISRSYDEQRRLREHYLRVKGINYDTPGSRNHA